MCLWSCRPAGGCASPPITACAWKPKPRRYQRRRAGLALVRFALALDPYLDRLEAAGVGRLNT
jgi:hypothetical protein